MLYDISYEEGYHDQFGYNLVALVINVDVKQCRINSNPN